MEILIQKGLIPRPNTFIFFFVILEYFKVNQGVLISTDNNIIKYASASCFSLSFSSYIYDFLDN